jgi:hypothetical protein
MFCFLFVTVPVNRVCCVMGKFAIVSFSAVHAVINILNADIFQHTCILLSHSFVDVLIVFH